MDETVQPASGQKAQHYLEEELYRLFRENPRLFRFIDQGSLDGIWYWDIEQPEHEWYSPRFCEILGYREDEIPHESKWWQEQIHPDDLKVALDNLAKHRDDPAHPYDQVVRYRHRDGSTVWVRCRGLLIRDEHGNPIRMLGAHIDVTELKRAEAKVRQHLEELAHVSRLSTMGQMAAGIAHELNQPLGAITNLAFLWRRKLAESAPENLEELRDVFERLYKQARRAGGIVNHLREFVEEARPRRVRTSIAETIDAVLTLVEAELRHYDVRLVRTVPASLPAVMADRIQIEQVILNLVRNAVEAMAAVPAASRRLGIAASTPSAEIVQIAVSDSGTGLPADNIDQVFEAFFTTKAHGMGMGLAISRSIIEGHEGRLWAEAAPDGGATFRLNLPVAQDACGVTE